MIAHCYTDKLANLDEVDTLLGEKNSHTKKMNTGKIKSLKRPIFIEFKEVSVIFN